MCLNDILFLAQSIKVIPITPAIIGSYAYMNLDGLSMVFNILGCWAIYSYLSAVLSYGSRCKKDLISSKAAFKYL